MYQVVAHRIKCECQTCLRILSFLKTSSPEMIQIYSYSKTNKMHLFLKLFILVKHYIFRAVFPSIIRSSRLHIQHKVYVKQILLTAC